MATVCVAIPTRNRPGYFAIALQSVLDQTYQDFHVVVSDNASEEDAARTVETHIRDLKDPRVSYRYQETDIREYGQGRYLFSQCGGRYFTILHDDDVWEPEFLQEAVDILDRDDTLALVVTNQYVLDEKGKRQPKLTEEYGVYQGRDRYAEGRLESMLDPLFTYGFFPITGTVFRASALRESGLVDDDCEGNYPFEFNLFLRLGERGMAAYYTTRRLVGYRFHRTSLRSTEARGLNQGMLETYLKLVERRRFSGALERKRRRSLAGPYRNSALLCFLAHDRQRCFGFLAKALWADPLSWKVWTYIVMVVFFPFVIRPLFGPKVVLRTKT